MSSVPAAPGAAAGDSAAVATPATRRARRDRERGVAPGADDHAGERPGGRGGQPHRRGRPRPARRCGRRAGADSDEQRRGGHRAQRPAQAEQEQPHADLVRRARRRRARRAPATTSSTTAPAASTGGRPNRSAAQPTSGANANMPSTWTLITMPITSQRRRRRGACAAASSPSPRPSPRAPGASADDAGGDTGPGRATTSRHAPPRRLRARRRRRARAPPRGRRSSGSGRSDTTMHRGGGEHPDAARTANGPVSAGSPSGRPARPARPVRFGPATAPMVVAHTTTDSARARCSGGREVGGGVARLVVRSGRRAEQRRARRAAAGTSRPRPRPRTARPRRRRAGSRRESPTRRPRRLISRASRNDATAAPSTCIVWARPASFSLPETCSASRAATAMPMRHAEPAERLRDDQRPDRAALHLLDPVVGPAHAAVQRRGPARPRPPTQRPPSRRRRLMGRSSAAHRSASGRSSRSHTARHTCLGGSPASSASTTVRCRGSAITCCSAQVRA